MDFRNKAHEELLGTLNTQTYYVLRITSHESQNQKSAPAHRGTNALLHEQENSSYLIRHQNGIDHMDHAVRLADVGDRDLCFSAFFVGQVKILAFHPRG